MPQKKVKGRGARNGIPAITAFKLSGEVRRQLREIAAWMSARDNFQRGMADALRYAVITTCDQIGKIP